MFDNLNILVTIITITWLAYTPITILFIFSIARRLKRKKKRRAEVPSDHFVFQITTNGKNKRCLFRTIVSIVESCVKARLENYEIWIVIDEGCSLNCFFKINRANIKIVSVPAQYRTRGGTIGKARALSYALNVRKWLKMVNAKIWVVMLDDDSVLTAGYLKAFFHTHKNGAKIAQGWLQMSTNFGDSLLASLMDAIRPFYCFIFCHLFNSMGKPLLVHGEGLVVRADVEAKVGWDFGGLCLAEDLIFGVKASKIAKFDWIDGYVKCQSPSSLRDLYIQRRRWLYGILDATKYLDWPRKMFIIYCFIGFPIGVVSLLGVVLTLSGIVSIGGFLTPLFVFNALMYFFAYQIGIWENAVGIGIKKKFAIHVFTLIWTWPLSALEAGTMIYALRRPKKFDVIKKY